MRTQKERANPIIEKGAYALLALMGGALLVVTGMWLSGAEFQEPDTMPIR